MKIRTKLYLNVLVSLILITFLLVSFFVTSNTINKDEERRTLAGDVKIVVAELNLLLDDYLLYRGERALKQWEIRYNSGLALLQKVVVEVEEEEGERGLIREISNEYLSLGRLFREAVENYEYGQKLVKEEASEEKIAVAIELQERKTSQLLVTSKSILSSADILQSIAQSRFIDAYNTGRVITIFLIMILLIIMMLVSIRVSRSILIPIHKLHQATEELEKGNFETRVDIKTNDELEQLGKSFNKTAEALEKLDEEHKQIDKSKINFLSITSHELRSPMTPMKAQLQMALQGYFGKLNKKQKEALSIVLNNTERLDKLILDLLEISRIEAAKIKFNFIKTNLDSNIKSLTKEMAGFMPEKNIKIISKIDKLPVIEADTDRVMQVLRNLVGNAIKFSKKNGKVMLIAEKKSDNILFSIKDSGIGIAKENQARIFQPFFQEEQTMSREYGGTGLGLAICKGIVKAQNGKIWFESEKGKGSTFYFTVPLKPVKVK